LALGFQSLEAFTFVGANYHFQVGVIGVSAIREPGALFLADLAAEVRNTVSRNRATICSS